MTTITELIDAYSRGHQPLREAVGDLPEHQLDARPIEGRWSIREVVCHLADSEIVYADRMKRVIAEQDPLFYEADPDLFGPALHCGQRSLATELDVIQVVRAHMAAILRALDQGQFERTGRHSLEGTLSLQTLLQRVTDHIPHHLAFINEKRRALQNTAGGA